MPLVLDNKRIIDLQMLLLLPVMVLISTMLPGFVGTEDLVRSHAWYVLLVQLLLIYIPTHLFISRRGGEHAFGLRRVSPAECVWAVLLGVGLCCLTNALEQALQLLYLGIGVNDVFFGKPLQVDGGWRLLALTLLIAVIPAYIEEALFRGVLLFSWLPGGKGRAVLHSTLLFSLLYMNPLSLPLIFVFGVALGLVSLWSGSFIPAVVIHCVNNLIAVLGAYLLNNASFAQAVAQAPGVGGQLLYNALIGVALTALCLPLFRRAAKKGAASRDETIAPSEEKQAEQTQPPLQAAQARTITVRSRLLYNPKLPVAMTYAFLVSINLLLLVMALLTPSIS